MHKSIYKDKNGKWYIHTSINGKTCTIRGFNSKTEADDEYDNAVENWKRQHGIFASGNLFDDIADDYVEYIRCGKSPRTADRERTQINTFWLPRFQGQLLKYIYNYDRLKIIYNDIKNDKDLNTRKKHDIVYTFLQFSNFAYINHYITKEILEETKIIFQPIHYVKSVEQERRVIPQSDLTEFLAVLENETEERYILFNLLVNCGLRISELLGLCNDCLVGNKIVIKRQLLVNGKLSNRLKTQQSYRSIPLNAKLLTDFTNYLSNVSKNKPKSDTYRLFKISHTQFKRDLYELEDKANIPHYVPHEFRHTFCFNKAQLAENISQVVYISKICGHSTSVFLNTYCAHLDNSLEQKFFE